MLKNLREEMWIPFTQLPTAEWLQTVLNPTVDISVLRCWYFTVHDHWALPPREISDHLVYFLVSGGCDGEIGGEAVQCTAGSLFWISPGVHHSFRLTPGLPPMTVYLFRFSVLREAIGLRPQEDAVVLHDAWHLRPYLGQIYDELRVCLPFHRERLHGLLGTFFSEILRARSLPIRYKGMLSDTDRIKLYQYMADHIQERPTSRELARVLKLSPDYFTRQFTKTFGCSPRTWITRERIYLAAQRLRDTTASIQTIAGEFGYHDYFLFSRQFKSIMGISPTHYRT